jgi:hypothetical protein
VEGKLLLIEEEWRDRSKEATDGSRGGSSGDRGGRGRGGSNDRGHGGRGDGVDASGGRRNNNNCHRYGKPGHWARECRSKQPKREEQAYTA